MEVSLRRCQATSWGESLVAIMALHTLSATASVCLRLSLSLSLSLCVCVHVSLPASLSVCVCLPVCVSLYVCILPAGLSVSESALSGSRVWQVRRDRPVAAATTAAATHADVELVPYERLRVRETLCWQRVVTLPPPVMPLLGCPAAPG